MALARILVDGYSLLHNWPELAPGKPRHSAAARDELIRVLTLYSDAVATPLTIVFDGSNAPAGTPPPHSSPDLEILYSRAGQTADDIIERVACRMREYGEVLAVTDDYAERDTVLSMDGLAASCRNFVRDVEKVLREQERDIARHNRRERVKFKEVKNCLLFGSALALFVLRLAFPSAAQAPPQNGNRFLFVINTSSAMRRMTNGIQEAVLGLLNSGMQGQVRDGDTLGIWTYDDQLHTGFPMQVWSNQNQGAIVQTVSNSLAQTHFQNSSHLENVLPAVRRLIEESRVVTLIFIFDGSEAMQGTGFDKDINDLHQEFGRQMRADNIPFVTTLAAHDGAVFDYRVRTPSSISLPPTADLIPPVATNTVPPVAAAAPPPAVVASQPSPSSQPPESRRREVVLRPAPQAETNTLPAPAPPVPSTTEPPPQSPNLNPNLNPNPNLSLNPNPNPATPAASPSNPQSAPSSVLSAAGPAKAEAVAEEEIRPASPSPRSAGNPPSAPSVAPHSAPPVVPEAVAMTAPANRLALLAIAISLVTIAVALVLLLFHRSRATPSLISRSMTRDQR